MIRNVVLLLALGLGWQHLVRAQAGTVLTGSIQAGGLVRDYRLYVPPSYRAGRPAPLLLNLHGYGSNAQEQEVYGDFRAIADTAGLLVVHPNGTPDASGNRYWNTFGPPGSGGPDDSAFLGALLDTLARRYTLDAGRVYSTGMSNGGFMSYELACRLGGRVAAIASVTGSIATTRLGSCAPAHPTPVLEIHGTADGTVPYAGNALFTPIPAVLSYWVQANGCAPTPTVTPVPDTDPTDGCTAERSVWSGGRNGAVVEHYRIIGGGHTWPGSAITIGVTNRDISASREIWRFLRPYRLGRLVLATAAPAAPTALSVYPNPVAGAATVWVSGGPALRPAQLRAFDALGRPVPLAATPAAGSAVQLDISSWPPGVYLLRVAGEAFSWSRLVK